MTTFLETLSFEIQKPFLSKQYLPEKSKLNTIVKTLWAKQERDYQLFGQELTAKYIKQFEKNDIKLLEYMITHQSWWDTVDFISTKLVGGYFKAYPKEKEVCIDTWLKSGNIWLQRSCLLFQLKYKQDLDVILLSSIIHQLLGSKEFFINKAIGWVLREYSRTNPQWVMDFVDATALSPLSKKEALRLVL